MTTAQRTTQAITRLEKRRDSIKKRLAGIARFDEVRHKGLKTIVEAVQQRTGSAATDDHLIQRVKEELDERINPPGLWEAITDFGIDAFVDVAVYYVRNRKKNLEQRLARIEARLERRRSSLRELMGGGSRNASMPVFSSLASMGEDDDDDDA
ncbi:hypothetical protein [Paraliomyxa miuraensis]|uniref:hypothetical protein n=1 Tax=Paraliomyxa miuraensis TaxID=376150 RepID=UPI00224EE468|nr:hypothetical protein [Paraliomyxa miuraensis]MCX4243064.1 hypothetical protein [Paraliomyxa miuraensis]